MRLHRGALISLVVVLTLAVIASGCPRPPAKKPLGPGLQITWFYENGAPGGVIPSSFPSLKQRHALIDFVSPFWFSISADGRLAGSGHDERAARFMRDRGLRIVPLVADDRRPGASPMALLGDSAARARATGALVRLATENGYDGYILDFQGVPADMSDDFVAFVRQFSTALHARGKTLGVNLPPRVDFPGEKTNGYDYARLAAASDYVVLMAFDRHREDTSPGPVAPLPWVRENVTAALRSVPANRLVLSVGVYGYDWPVNARLGVTDFLPTRALMERARRVGARIKRDPEADQPFFRYRSGPIDRVAWFQDAEALRRRLDLARSFGLRGVAIWRLGFEEPATWRVLSGRG